MNAFTGFVEETGECLAACGGDSISGHAPDCEVGKAAACLAAVNEAFDRYKEYRRRNTLNFQLEKLDDYMRQLEVALKGGAG